MPKTTPRDISPLLQKLRNFLLGRQHTTALRFEENVASRSPPPPELPDGPCHKINTNYYYARDVRREVKPPLLVASKQAAIAAEAAGKSKESDSKKTGATDKGAFLKPPKKLPTPGKVYFWDKI